EIKAKTSCFQNNPQFPGYLFVHWKVRVERIVSWTSRDQRCGRKSSVVDRANVRSSERINRYIKKANKSHRRTHLKLQSAIFAPSAAHLLAVHQAGHIAGSVSASGIITKQLLLVEPIDILVD